MCLCWLGHVENLRNVDMLKASSNVVGGVWLREPQMLWHICLLQEDGSSPSIFFGKGPDGLPAHHISCVIRVMILLWPLPWFLFRIPFQFVIVFLLPCAVSMIISFVQKKNYWNIEVKVLNRYIGVRCTCIWFARLV